MGGTLLDRPLVEEGMKHLMNVESRFSKLMKRSRDPVFQKRNSSFEALVTSIIYQQLAGAAANTIHKRFLTLFERSEFPSPEFLSHTPADRLRSAGLSQRKAEYVIGLGVAFSENGRMPDSFDGLSDTEVHDILLPIRGVGQWTVDMFLIFTLHRPDIMPFTDLGIKKGMKIFFNLESNPDRDEMDTLSHPWKPYRSLGAWYMWELADNTLPGESY